MLKDLLYITLWNDWVQGKPFAALRAKREDILRYLSELSQYGFTITMPCCGYEQRFILPNDIPYSDMPCPCGAKDHYVVKLDAGRTNGKSQDS